MSNNLEDWETQQEAKRAAAHKEGPLTFLAGGGAAASRKNREEHRISDELAHEQARHKTLVETTLKALRNAVFPDEVAHFQDVLLKLNLTPEEQEELRKVMWEKIK